MYKRQVQEREYSTGAEFVEDFIDSRNGELAKDAEFVQLLIADLKLKADATGFLRDDNHWAHPWRCGVLDEARGEDLVRVHWLGVRRIDVVGRDAT